MMNNFIRKYCMWVIAVILLSFQLPQKKIKIFMAGDSTMSIKEIRAYPETGWGMPFVHFFDSTVTVVNKAKNGRSTKTFIEEGLWSTIIKDVQEGDYVFIQFGHNDESPEKKERYTTTTQYRTNILRFINETLSKKGIPVLLTPVSRRRFDSSGSAIESHKAYSAIVREIAKETNVYFIDLDERSRALYQKLGRENSRLLFLQLKPGEHPNYPEGKDDNTHFNELGARMIAQLVWAEMRSLKIPLIERIVTTIKK